MSDELDRSMAAPPKSMRSRRERGLRSAWRAIRRPLVQSGLFKSALASSLTAAFRFVAWTNRTDFDADAIHAEHTPTIIALWHGQHLLIPFYHPRGKRLVIMVSRSADAEMNALVIEKLGLEAVRGSGGREQRRHLEKGGATALIALKRALDAGDNVAMIADIPHGTPREAGLGIITLAKLSGRSILPLALASSRRKVIDKSWDKTTISLPFGRACLTVGEPVWVPANADDAAMEEKRRELTATLNAATAEAYRKADGLP
jgi:lysophospholipid acyltransferase (LPLAT)-like uncharacterized protein